MKIAPRQVNSFLRAPAPEVRGVLVYGPDLGLVRERGDMVARTVVQDLSDPFLVADLTIAQIRDVPTLIADEAAAIALTGGRRVVRIRDAGDAVAGPVEMFLEDAPGDALVVVYAGALSARSTLRKLFEGAPNGAAIACYADDAQTLDRVIHETLQASGVSIDAEAAAYLADNLGSDRGVSRSELDKLVLYAGSGGTVTIEDAMASVGNSSALSLDDVVMSAFDGNGLSADRALTRCFQEGSGPVPVLRALGRHLARLQLAVAKVQDGSSADAAMKALRPPVFFKQTGAFRQQMRRWNIRKLATAQTLVLDAERQTKQTGMPAEAICGRTVLQISKLATTGRR